MTPRTDIFVYTDHTGTERRADPFALWELCCYHADLLKADFYQLLRSSAATREVRNDKKMQVLVDVPATTPEGEVLTDADSKPLLRTEHLKEPDYATRQEPRELLRTITCNVFKVQRYGDDHPDGFFVNQLDGLLDSFLRFCQKKSEPPVACPTLPTLTAA